jgi:RimJ/RimL family protein N-acetyltransferase
MPRWQDGGVRHDVRLERDGIRLVPLDDHHSTALFALVDEEMWANMGSVVPRSVADMRSWIATAHVTEGRWAFAVIGPDGEVRGSTSCYDWEDRVRRVEIGYTFYGRQWWGGRTNPTCKLLLLEHAFEVWDARRVALRADSRNQRSIGAIRRLGAVPEGVLRHHRIASDGALADTAYFSILPDEWPAVRSGLLARLED